MIYLPHTTKTIPSHKNTANNIQQILNHLFRSYCSNFVFKKFFLNLLFVCGLHQFHVDVRHFHVIDIIDQGQQLGIATRHVPVGGNRVGRHQTPPGNCAPAAMDD